MTTQKISGLRRLPMSGPDGKPAYVPEGGAGVVTAIADAIEATTVDDAAEVLGHARRMLADPAATRSELRFTGKRLAEVLDATLRVAQCRGDRLPQVDE